MPPVSGATAVVARSEREKYDLAQITKLLRGIQAKKGKSLQLYSGTFAPVEANQRFRRSAFANP